MMIVLISVLAGIISGFGIGGGAVLIPALLIFTDISQHSAQTVNLCYFIPTALCALYIHFKNKNICLKEALYFMLTGVPAAIFSSILASRTEEHFLRYAFAAFLVIVAVLEFFKKPSAS